MALTTILDMRLKPDAVAAAPDALRKILADTRAFDGCLRVDVLIDTADPTHVVLYELWESEERDAAYRAWRATPAGASGLGELLGAPPTVSKLQLAADI
jgi:quinol monooxygenase YgiN